MASKFAAIALALTLAGCATAATQDTEGKALADAWSGLNAAALGADTAVKAGYLHGVEASRVSNDLKAATFALTAATDAYHVNEADPSVAGQVDTALTLITEVMSLSKEPAK